MINLQTESADKGGMTRRVSPLAPAPSNAHAVATREDLVRHEDSSVHSFGEIISLRSGAPLETAEAFRESEARLRAILSSLDDLVFELDEDGVYLALWTTSEALLVAPPEELLGRTVRHALGDDLGRRVTRAVRRVLETGRPELLEYNLDVQAGARFFQARFAPIAGLAARTVCLLVRDITAQKEAEAARDDAESRLRHQALHDGLTDLPNRVFFLDRLDHALKRTRRRRENLAVLMLDVDGFKEINDNLGHSSGDEVLREVAQRLASAIREGDSIARLGGDEFAILLPNASEEDGLRVAQRVSDSLGDPLIVGSNAIKVDVSVGVAVFLRDGSDAEALLKSADAAMYAAKRAKIQAGLRRLRIERPVHEVAVRWFLPYKP
jgi:diguanylate cyclase (GGDEF)-like protein/PAS domain S-box-containing protein